MPITALTIENFKGVRDQVRIEFRPITLLFGPNSSGKSTILQALPYAREIFERENVDPGRTLAGGSSVDLGGFLNFVNEHDPGKILKLRFDLDLNGERFKFMHPPDRPELAQTSEYDYSYLAFRANSLVEGAETAWIEITIQWSSLLEKPVVRSYEVGLNGESFACITATEDGRQVYLSYLDWKHPLVVREAEADKAARIEAEEAEDKDEPLNLLHLILGEIIVSEHWKGDKNIYFGIKDLRSALPKFAGSLELDAGLFRSESQSGVEDEHGLTTLLRYVLAAMIQGPGEVVSDCLRQMRYIGPLREVPARNHEPSRSPDETLWANGLAAWDVLHKKGSDFIESVNQWLSRKDRLNSGYSVERQQYKELFLHSPLMLAFKQERTLDEEYLSEQIDGLPTKTRLFLREIGDGIWPGLQVLPQDIGVGISQLLPVVVGALCTREMILMVEQPELHVHPAIQVALGDLFISQIQDRDVSFLIETHSEHLLLRLLRRMRERFENQLPEGVYGLTPQQLSIYNIVNTEAGIKATELRVTEDGDSLGKWPEGFFEERHRELY